MRPGALILSLIILWVIEVVSNLIEYEGDFVEHKGGYTIPLRAILKVEM